MIRFEKFSASSKLVVGCRSILAGLMLVAMVPAWGCGGKEAAPPPGVKGPTEAPTVTMPDSEPTTPPKDKENK